MNTENIISAVCSASGAVFGGGAGQVLSFSLKSNVKKQTMLTGGVYELCGVLYASGNDRKKALEALDAAVNALCGYSDDAICKIYAPSPAVLRYDDGFGLEREIIIIAREE